MAEATPQSPPGRGAREGGRGGDLKEIKRGCSSSRLGVDLA